MVLDTGVSISVIALFLARQLNVQLKDYLQPFKWQVASDKCAMTEMTRAQTVMDPLHTRVDQSLLGGSRAVEITGHSSSYIIPNQLFVT